METALITGLRISDVLNFKTRDIQHKTFTIREAKTGKKRKLTLPDDLRRRLLSCSGAVYVFPNRDDGNRHRTRQAVWKDVRRAAKALRIRERVSTHTARKMYAAKLYDRYGGDVEKVQKALNHTSPDVTFMFYLRDYVKDHIPMT